MDAQRAQEILDSPDMRNVTYNGDRVYIEHVDQGTGHCTIHPIENPEQKYMVTVEQLQEQ